MYFYIKLRDEHIMKIFLFVIILIFLYSCSKREETGNEEENNTTLQTEQVKKVMEIGGWDAPLEESFYKISDVEVDKWGNIYVADMGNIRIQKFSPKGKLLLSISKRGQGPGELGMTFTIELDEAGNLYVVDSNNARMQKFSKEGQFIKSLNDPIYDFNDFEVFKGSIFFRHVYMPDNMLFETDTSLNNLKPIIPIDSKIKNDFSKVTGNMVSFCVTNDSTFYFFNSNTEKFYKISYNGYLQDIFPLKCQTLENLISKEMNRIEENNRKRNIKSTDYTYPIISNLSFFNNSIFFMYNIEIENSGKSGRKRESFLFQIDRECNFLKEYIGFKNSWQTFSFDKNKFIYAIDFDEAKVIKYSSSFINLD